MPRTKGSKNKTALPVEERISAVIAEIEAMEEQLKQKKAALKQLKAEKKKRIRRRSGCGCRQRKIGGGSNRASGNVGK